MTAGKLKGTIGATLAALVIGGVIGCGGGSSNSAKVSPQISKVLRCLDAQYKSNVADGMMDADAQSNAVDNCADQDQGGTAAAIWIPPGWPDSTTPPDGSVVTPPPPPPDPYSTIVPMINQTETVHSLIQSIAQTGTPIACRIGQSVDYEGDITFEFYAAGLGGFSFTFPPEGPISPASGERIYTPPTSGDVCTINSSGTVSVP